MAYIGNSPALNESVDTAQLASPLTLAGNLTLGSDADGTDRLLSFGHSTLKSVIGIDDSADAFAINTDNAFETSNDFAIDANGIITMPRQPAFLSADIDADHDFTTSWAKVAGWSTPIFDQNSDFNTSTDLFTAPVTGRYLIAYQLRSTGFTDGDDIEVRLVASNRTMHNFFLAAERSGAYAYATFSELVDMDASDTVYVEVVNGTGVRGSVNTGQTFFSGVLIC